MTQSTLLKTPPTRRTANGRSGKSAGSGFTLIELLVVIAIISLLAAILFPVFSRVRENARRSSCQSNLSQISTGLLLYEQDYDERFPPLNTGNYNSSTTPYLFWPYFTQPYYKNGQLFDCPDFHYPNTVTIPPSGANFWVAGNNAAYGMNVATSTGGYPVYKGRSLTVVKSPSELGLLFESSLEAAPGTCQGYWINTTGWGSQQSGYAQTWWTAGTTDSPGVSGTYDYGTPDGRHFTGLNIGFADGHVKWLPYGEVITKPASVTNANWRLWHPDAA